MNYNQPVLEFKFKYFNVHELEFQFLNLHVVNWPEDTYIKSESFT